MSRSAFHAFPARPAPGCPGRINFPRKPLDSGRPRFALAAGDAYRCVLEAFLGAGWQLEKLFVPPGDWMYDNREVTARALDLGAAVQHSPAAGRDLAELGHDGCPALVVAGYPWKIPAWGAALEYAVNFHPAPLPEARGPYPLVRAILERRSSWAVTCHRINEKFDQGDILDAESFAVGPDECHETMSLKAQMATARLAGRVASAFEARWRTALPQGPGSYWPLWTEQERTIDFSQGVEAVMRQIRAFGDLECIAQVNEVNIFVHRAKGWIEPTSARPGTVVYANNLALVVAAADGLIAITEWSFNAPGTITSKTRR